ncbi:MAG: hypothetical protein R3C71_03565 [Candidatus Krumholzibacteriia bacterium]|nr:hypothetical protein [bacterium]MCB9513310.1 hypothetical protein [Candidatus Latescibacterota bacterium]MCB9514770.1 hypothetical protein [Candidatus Latescibacterota bacterium]
MSPDESPQDDPRFAELEARLHALLREKYHEHWRQKDGKPLDEAAARRLQEIQTRLREAFDEIRLIDRKYKIPPLKMHE